MAAPSDNSTNENSNNLLPHTGEGVVMDIGTGDGRFVYRSAQENPRKFYIGIDANAKPLEKISMKATRKPAKGGLHNVLFVRAAVEDLPEPRNIPGPFNVTRTKVLPCFGDVSSPCVLSGAHTPVKQLAICRSLLLFYLVKSPIDRTAVCIRANYEICPDVNLAWSSRSMPRVLPPVWKNCCRGPRLNNR